MSAPALAALATFLSIFLLDITESFDPAGSPLGWIIMVGLIAGHVPLIRETFGGPRWRWNFELNRKLAMIVAVVLVVVCSAWALRSASRNIFQVPVTPGESAQLGLITQVASRMETDNLLYGYTYRQHDVPVLNAFPVGAILPFAVVRNHGYDWRYASLLAVLFLACLSLAQIVGIAPFATKRNAMQLIVIALAGSSWLIFRRSGDYFNWGHVLVFWPLIMLLGISLADGAVLVAALLAGILASMSAGWLLLLPVVAAFLYAESKNKFAITLAALLVFPVCAYSIFHSEFEQILQGMFGQLFTQGRNLETIGSSRFANIHALGDWFSLRYLVYTLAIATVVFLSVRIARCGDRAGRLRMFALAAFVVTACAPVTYFFHWISYSVLLASLLHGFIAEEESLSLPTPFSWKPIAVGVAFGVLAFIFLSAPSRGGIDGSIDRLPGNAQGVDRNLLSGFNVRSEDHAWGKSPRMVTGFTLDRARDGLLELHLGTLGGEFTPFNRTEIRVNGRAKGTFRVLPGDYGYARIPLTRDDVFVGFNIVELNASWARTPRSLGVGTDDRTLSINYLGMRFLPAEATQLAARK